MRHGLGTSPTYAGSRCLGVLVPMLLAAGVCVGQISIENQSSVSVPRDRAWVIYQSACQVVAERFHIKNSAALQVPLKLAIGRVESGVFYDEAAGEYEIRLKEWGDTQFAFAAVRLTLQRLVSLQQRRDLLLETLARAERKLPVSSGSFAHQLPHTSDSQPGRPLCPLAISAMDCDFGPRSRR